MRNANLTPWPVRPGVRFALVAVVSLAVLCVAAYKTMQAWPPLLRYYYPQYILSEISRPEGVTKNHIVLAVTRRGDRRQALNSDVETGSAIERNGKLLPFTLSTLAQNQGFVALEDVPTVECPALFVPVEMRQTGTEGAFGWHVERSILRSRL
jgi:hypothetical protein